MKNNVNRPDYDTEDVTGDEYAVSLTFPIVILFFLFEKDTSASKLSDTSQLLNASNKFTDVSTMK